MIKKNKILNVIILAVILLMAVMAVPVYASDETAADKEQEVMAQDYTELEEEEIIQENFSENDEIHYTTGGSAAEREIQNAACMESESEISGSAVKIVPSFTSLYAGQTKLLQLEDTTASTLIWTSSNDSVAAVDAGGNVTGISKGFAVIRATDINGNYDAVKVFVGYYIGVDLDAYQGTLDGNTLLSSGIDFAIIRRGYGNLEDTSQLDREFENTYNILKNAGIPVGTYLFNYFESTSNAIEEAESLYNCIRDLSFELGVYSDFEEGGYYSSYEYYKRINGQYPTPAQITEMNTAFLETLKNKLDSETPVGYYSSMAQCSDWYSEEFKSTYPLWAAYWKYRTDDSNEDGGSTYSVLYDKIKDKLGTYSYLTGNMVMHQYSSEELAYKIGGTGWLDVDVIDMDSPLALRFVKVDAAVNSDGQDAVISWNKPSGADNIDGYIIYRTVNDNTEQIAVVDGSDGNLYTDINPVYGAFYSVKAYSQCGGTVVYSQNGNSSQYSYNSAVYEGVDYSAVYDFDFYYNKYSDLRKAFGTDASKFIQHFVEFGMKEGRQAKADFNVTAYKNRYEDLRRAFGIDLKSYYFHYMQYGKNEGRNATGNVAAPKHKTVYNGVDYSAVYDMDYYYGTYPDLRKAFGYDENKLLEHFVKYGMKEGRRARSDFNVTAYKNRYSDLRRAFGDNLVKYYEHYITYGKGEGRKAV